VKLVTAILAVALLAGCALPGFSELRGGATPDVDAPVELQPIGPVVELGRGEAHGFAWRYTVWESRMGSCWSIESPSGGSTSCGGALGSGQMPLSVAGVSSGTEMPFVVDGFAGAEVASVAVALADGARVPATLVSLGRMGVAGNAFIAVIPAGRPPLEVVALDANGGVVAREPLHVR
jgi:hypothetical protein